MCFFGGFQVDLGTHLGGSNLQKSQTALQFLTCFRYVTLWPAGPACQRRHQMKTNIKIRRASGVLDLAHLTYISFTYSLALAKL